MKVGTSGSNPLVVRYRGCCSVAGSQDDTMEPSNDAIERVAKNRTRSGHVMKNEDFDAHGQPRLLRVGFQSPFQLSFNTAGLSTKV